MVLHIQTLILANFETLQCYFLIKSNNLFMCIIQGYYEGYQDGWYERYHGIIRRPLPPPIPSVSNCMC